MTTRPMQRPDRIAVIGVGVIGACVGWHLSRQGAQVTLIDAGHPGEGVTDWTFSWVNASNKTARRSYFDLNLAGMAAYRDLATAIGPGSWWHPSGHLRWTDDVAALLSTAESLTDLGYRVETYQGSEARRRLEPALTIPDEVPVVFYPDEAWVHGRHLVGRLVGRTDAEHRFGTAVSAIDTASDGSIRTITLSDGSRLDVDIIVNAAGPGAAHIAALIGRHLPMRHEPGLVLRISSGRTPIHRVVHAPHLALRPDGDTTTVLHSNEVDAHIDTGETPATLARRLHEAARHVVPALGDSRITGSRVAERPIPADGYPSVGAVPSVPGYYEAVSHSGITLGPIIGRLLATEIFSGERAKPLANFRPERFPR